LDIFALDVAQITETLQEWLKHKFARAGGNENADSVGFRLLRLSGRGKRKEESAKRETEDLPVFTIAYCLLPNACFHRITLSAMRHSSA
jgi:hypothetical protein